MSLSIILSLFLLTPQSKAQGYIHFERDNPYAIYTHEAPVNVIHLTNSPWTQTEISANLKESARVFAQCGVRLRVKRISYAYNRPKEVMFDLDGYTEPNEPHERYGALNLARRYSNPKFLNLFFIHSFDIDFGTITATAMPPERIKYKDQTPALNTLWFTHKIEQMRKERALPSGINTGYSVLAHEMGHVLLNDSHVLDPHVHNLMHEWVQNQNGRLTLSQCEKIKTSPLVNPLPQKNRSSRSTSCPEVHSPLRGGIYFQDQRETDCTQLDSLLNILAQVQDATSDLQPVKQIDFYLKHRTNLVRYLDRYAFEASLTPTYDAHGRYRIHPAHARTLWIHELGHAILNAQLIKDWPWFKKRDQYMLAWGRSVFESTQSQNRLVQAFFEFAGRSVRKRFIDLHNMEFDDVVNEQISNIATLPHAEEFEELLAPYHEFFADALVLIYTKNPKALRDALANPMDPEGQFALPEELLELEERDYSYLRDVNTWGSLDLHGHFTPTLALLWKYISNNSQKQNPRTDQELLRKVYNAVLLEVKDRARDKNLWRLSAPEANVRLIRNLRL